MKYYTGIGNREISLDDMNRITSISKTIITHILRSGGADGSDVDHQQVDF